MWGTLSKNRQVQHPSERKQFITIFIIILILRKHAMVDTESSDLNLETYTLIIILFI